MPHLKLFTIATIFFITSSAQAQDDPTSIFPANSEPKLPLWELGLAGLGFTQAAYPGSENRTNLALALPYIIYRGKYLRTDRGTVGIRTVKTPRYEVDVGLAGAIGSHSSDIEARRGMADLGTMIEFGPRLKINLGNLSNDQNYSRLQLPLRGVIDVSHEFRFKGIAFEPRWVTETELTDRWKINSTLGAVFGYGELTNTFYGVAPNEATPTRASYSSKPGLIALRAGLSASHKLTADARVFLAIRLESLTGAANNESPLIRQNSGWSAGVGFAWGLAYSERDAID